MKINVGTIKFWKHIGIIIILDVSKGSNENVWEPNFLIKTRYINLILPKRLYMCNCVTQKTLITLYKTNEI